MKNNYKLRILTLLTILYGSNVNSMAVPWSDLISKGIQLIASNPEKATEVAAAIIHKFSSRDTVAIPLEQNKAGITECVSKPEEKKDPIPPASSKPEKELAPGASCVNFPEPSLNINKCPSFKDKNEQEISSICESSKIKEDIPKGSCGGIQWGEGYTEETNQDSSQESKEEESKENTPKYEIIPAVEDKSNTPEIVSDTENSSSESNEIESTSTEKTEENYQGDDNKIQSALEEDHLPQNFIDKIMQEIENNIKIIKEQAKDGLQNVCYNGVLCTLEDIEKLKNGLVLQDEKGNICIYNGPHGLGGDAIKKQVGGLHFLWTKKVLKFLEYQNKTPENFMNTNVIKIRWKLKGEEFKDQRAKPSTIYIGDLDNYIKILNEGWENAKQNGALAEARKTKGDGCKGWVDVVGKSKCGLTIVFKGLEILPGDKLKFTTIYVGDENFLKSNTKVNLPVPYQGPQGKVGVTNSSNSNVLTKDEIVIYENDIYQIIATKVPTETTVEDSRSPITKELFPTFGQLLDKIKNDLGKFKLDTITPPVRAPQWDGQLTVGYRKEIIYLKPEHFNTPRHEFLRKNSEYIHLMNTNPQFVQYMQQWQQTLISLAAATNCPPSTSKFDYPIIAKMLLITLNVDPYIIGASFNNLRETLIKIYFDNKTGALKEYLTGSEEEAATRAIVYFLYDISPDMNFYRKNIEIFRENKLKYLNDVLRKDEALQAKPWTVIPKRDPVVLLYRDLSMVKRILNHPVSSQVYDISQLLLNHKFTQAKELIDNINCSGEMKFDLDNAFKIVFHDTHTPQGVYKGYLSDPILKTMTQEDYKQQCSDFESIEKFNRFLETRNFVAREWAKVFNINIDQADEIVREKLYSFAALSESSEKAIASLVDLSSDVDNDIEKNCYKVFFNDQGILKNLLDNKLIKDYKFPSILSTSKAKVLRKYLNYTLTLKVTDQNEKHIRQLLDYIKSTAEDLETIKKVPYIGFIYTLYNSLTIKNADKTVLQYPSFLNKYQNPEKQTLQDNFVRVSNNCLISLVRFEDIETYKKKTKLAKYVLDLSNAGQTCLANGDVQTAQVAWQKLLDLIS